VDEGVPSCAACLYDLLICVPHDVTKIVATQVFPDVLDRVQLGGIGWQTEQGDIVRNRGLAFKAIEDRQIIQGRLIGSTQLASGRCSMIDDGLGFSLVPWRPVIEKEIGREVLGVMRGTDISWQLGRKLGLGI
jgi:hypothetical protein